MVWVIGESEEFHLFTDYFAEAKTCQTARSKTEQSVVQPFVETIMDIIMVDDHVDNRERAFLIRIMDLLEQDGYDIRLPI
jgi:hypothetical protein